MSPPRDVEVLEDFTFADGSVRLAWVTWRIGDGDRRCVGVREMDADFKKQNALGDSYEFPVILARVDGGGK